jgi:hypothetical protein
MTTKPMRRGVQSLPVTVVGRLIPLHDETLGSGRIVPDDCLQTAMPGHGVVSISLIDVDCQPELCDQLNDLLSLRNSLMVEVQPFLSR